jgi:hypothetical protein
MRVRCTSCNRIWTTSKIRANEVNPQDPLSLSAAGPCRCGSSQLEWVLQPMYQGKVLNTKTVVKGASFSQTHSWRDKVMGSVSSDPRIFQLRDEDGNPFIWLPYWITVGGRKKYGQFSQMIEEGLFAELLKNAIRGVLFGEETIHILKETLASKRE